MKKTRLWNGREITGEAAVVDNLVDALKMQRARELATIERWGKDKATAMTLLCQSFPTLRDASGTAPWDAMLFLRWLCTSEAVTTGSHHAGRFVLQVWDPSADWEAAANAPTSESGLGLTGIELAPFNVVRAIARWDDAHESAFRAWVELPFWP